jgi:hypothetical protein
MKPYSKICGVFCTVGHSAGFGYAQWATAQDFVMHFILGHNKGFFYALWLIAQDFVMHHGP